MRRCGPILRALAGLLMAVTILSATSLRAAPLSPPAVAMRPYTGIGILLLATAFDENGLVQQLVLYADPAIYRLGALEIARVPRHEGIFGPGAEHIPLIVMARKGAWSRVVYDDAGREAWINPGRRGTFYTWDGFFNDRTGYLLPGLQKRFYQLFREPGIAPLVSLSPRQPFKVAKQEGDWVRLVASDRNPDGWLRWRDEDGRLLIGSEQGGEPPVRQR